jgi:hypothetical protein
MPTTFEELIKKSQECYNCGKYSPVTWKQIAKWLSNKYGFNGAYVVLDSKHMRWCADMCNGKTSFKKFVTYFESEITDAEVTFLLESY